MKIFIKAKPMSYQEKVEKIDGTHFIVWVIEPPQNGLANRGIVKALANYFKVSQSRIIIKKGFTSKNKVVEIA
jgi:uncharacterized protein YggU (UPF0235/DUF167 family)